MDIKLVDEQPSTVKEHQKSQIVRAYDVFLLAPFLMYIGYKAKGISKWERYAIYAIGIGTFVYNARNYIKNENTH